MSVSIDITDQDVYTALVTLLATIVPSGTPIVQGLDNQVAMPATGFVLMTGLGIERLGTNVDVNNGTTLTQTSQMAARYTVQLDFVGPLAQSWAMQVQALFRDEYAADLMPANIQPLYADDPMLIPLVNAESQYEQRWKVTAAIQYKPTITTPQQSATSLSIGIKPIDTYYHP